MFARVFIGMAIGTLSAAIYSSLVAFVHLAAHGRWDGVHRTAVWFALVGAIIGLIGGVAWAWPEHREAPATRNLRYARRTMESIAEPGAVDGVAITP
jgi:uncharacterized iron-regulated membrane protein